jgi:exopolyphosphatase/guanosine-5'-triphosphate,3'-diphosphate pyrophosphatase
MRRAVIDIGTNSIKLLVADVTAQAIVPVREQSKQTRLGQGFYPEHCLQPEPIQRTAEAVARFGNLAREAGADSVRVIATSAVREARNQADLVHAVRDAAGLDVAVITGEQEAGFVYAGVRSDPALAGGRLLILEVGGGSTEFIFGHGPEPEYRGCFSLGTVRLLEQLRPKDPPSATDWAACRSRVEGILNRAVAPELEPHLATGGGVPLRVVGTGGTCSILASMEHQLTAFDRARIEQTVLSRERLWEHQRWLWGLPLAERQNIPGLPPNRADVILFGVAVFVLTLEKWRFDLVRMSTRGLRFGALLGG